VPITVSTSACAAPAPVPAPVPVPVPVPVPAPAPAASACTVYASPAGDDAAAGTSAAPVRTAAKLVSKLRAGDTGCLRAGTYGEDLKLSAGGAQGNPITLTSAPGESATLLGRLYVADTANDVVFKGLKLNGKNSGGLPSPSVTGDRISFVGNDVTNDHTAICFTIGSDSGYGVANDVLISHNRIHDCGKVPSGNRDHGIYIENSRNARIVDNFIYDNVDRGVQLFPSSIGTIVERNVIDGNGQGVAFGGDLGLTSTGNRVRNNIITNANLRYNVEAWWSSASPVGSDNLVDGNCIWNGKTGNIGEVVGFTLGTNTTADPLFVDRAGKDFRLKAGSPCTGKGPA
jgi:parallel beta-helix repeat protein